MTSRRGDRRRRGDRPLGRLRPGAARGSPSTVLDRGELGREASWAGAGLIPANTERLRTNPTVELRSWSAVLYPEWSAALREETGIDNGYRRTGGRRRRLHRRRGPRPPVDGRPLAGRGDRLRAARARATSRGSSRRSAPTSASPTSSPTAPRSATPGTSRPWPPPLTPRGVTLRPGRGGRRLRDGAAGGSSAVGTATGRSPAARSSSRRAPGRAACSTGSGSARRRPPLKGQIVLLRGRPAAAPADRRARQELPGPPRRRPDPDRRDRGRRRVRHPADPGRRPRPARRGPAALPGPGRGRGRDDLGGPPAGERRHPALPRPGARLSPTPSSPPATSAPGLQLSPATAEVIADLVLGRPPRIDLAPFRVGREPGGRPTTRRSGREPRIGRASIRRDDQHLGRRRVAEGDGPVAEPEDQGAGLGAVLDRARPRRRGRARTRSGSGGRPGPGRRPGRPGTAGRRPSSASGVPCGLGQRAVGPGDRVAVGVDGRVAEEGVDPVDQPVGGGVLHVLGLLVDLVPGHLRGSGPGTARGAGGGGGPSWPAAGPTAVSRAPS